MITFNQKVIIYEKWLFTGPSFNGKLCFWKINWNVMLCPTGNPGDLILDLGPLFCPRSPFLLFLDLRMQNNSCESLLPLLNIVWQLVNFRVTPFKKSPLRFYPTFLERQCWIMKGLTSNWNFQYFSGPLNQGWIFILKWIISTQARVIFFHGGPVFLNLLFKVDEYWFKKCLQLL